MKILLMGIAVVFALGVLTPLSDARSADLQLAAADTAKKAAKPKRHPGRKVYMRKTCLACHGRNGAKAIQDYPNVAGQDEKYMIQQIKDIMKGKRTGSPDKTGNPRSEGMRGALVTPEGEMRLTDQEIKDVANYLANLKPASPKLLAEPLSADAVKEGVRLYNKYKCKTCHGKEGKKPKKGYPYIAGQKRDYIITQMQDIKDKVRKNSKSKLMTPFMKKISGEEIAVLADYLSQIDRNAAK